MRRSLRTGGFSLIELVIAAAIMGILMALALPMATSYLNDRRVRNAAEVFLSDATKAKAEAAQRNRPIELALLTAPFTNDDDAAVSQSKGWAIRCRAWDNCRRPDEAADSSKPVYYIGRMSLAEGASDVTVTATNADGTAAAAVGFTPLGGTTLSQRVDFKFTHDTGGACIAAGQSNGVRCLTVQITSTGKIKLCDPAVTTAGDTRLCNSN